MCCLPDYDFSFQNQEEFQCNDQEQLSIERCNRVSALNFIFSEAWNAGAPCVIAFMFRTEIIPRCASQWSWPYPQKQQAEFPLHRSLTQLQVLTFMHCERFVARATTSVVGPEFQRSLKEVIFPRTIVVFWGFVLLLLRCLQGPNAGFLRFNLADRKDISRDRSYFVWAPRCS